MRAVLISLIFWSWTASGSQVQTLTDSITIQQSAINGLRGILKTSQDPALSASILQRMIEGNEKLSTVQFQLANLKASASKAPTSIDLTEYQTTLKQIVGDCTTYLTQYPKAPSNQRVMLTRAKTYQLLEKNDLAESDYATLAFATPKNAITSLAAVSLAFLRYDLGRYEVAVLTIQKLQIPNTDPYYLAIQVKLANALSKLVRNKEGLKVVQDLQAYKDKMDRGTLRDYLATAIEVQVGAMKQQVPGVSLTTLVQFLKDTAPADLQYSPLELIASQLIRTDQDENLARLDGFTHELVPAADRDEATARYLILRLEHQLDQKRTADLPLTFDRIRTLVLPSKSQSRLLTKLYSVLTRSLETLRKGATDTSTQHLECLKLGYQLALDVPGHPASDDYLLHYNLAEAAFRAHQFDLATKHYQLAASLKKGAKPEESLDLKLISARYQDFLARHLFPDQILPVSIAVSDAKMQSVDPQLNEWILWIDQKSALMGNLSDTDRQTLGEFDYQAARALYSSGQVRKAMTRLSKIMDQHPTDPVALKAALLFFDTEVQSKAWKTLVEESTSALDRFQKLTKVNPELVQKLKKYRHDADYQLIKEAFLRKDFVASNALAAKHLKSYPDSPYQNDLYGMLGVTAASNGDAVSAKKFFAKVDLSRATGDTKNIALANAVDEALHRFDWMGVSNAYLKWFQEGSFKSPQDRQKIAKSALQITWISQSQAQLHRAVGIVCKSDAAVAIGECAEQEAWEAHLNHLDLGASRKAMTTPFGIALQEVSQVKDDFTHFKKVGDLWKTLTASEKNALIPALELGVGSHLTSQRAEVRKKSPIALNPSAIQKRVKLLAELEQKVTEAKNFGWVGIQYGALKTASLAYADFVQDINSMTPPKGMAAPERESFKQMLSQNAEPFQIKSKAYLDQAVALHPLALASLALDAIASKWTFVVPNEAFKKTLIQALRERRLIEASYLLQQSQSNGWLAPQSEKLVMATILALNGGATESEPLFREALVSSDAVQFRSLIPERVPASGGNQK